MILTQFFSRLVAVALLGAILATGAGAVCLLPAASAHPSMAGCHPVRVPSPPQPADYRCCVSRHPAALLTNVVPPRPMLQPWQAAAVDVLVAANGENVFTAAMASSSGPPGVISLRI